MSQSSSKETIKSIIVNILYLDSIDEINDDDPLFGRLGMSSIDYIDLCFELKTKCNSNVSPEKLWPINSMMLDEQYYVNDNWTPKGCDVLQGIFQVKLDFYKDAPEKLNDLFTVQFIEKRLQELK